MYGFLVSSEMEQVSSVLTAPQVLKYNGIQFQYSPLPKFERDHLFFETEELIVLLDGVILNQAELFEEENNWNWKEVFVSLYHRAPRNFMQWLRGPFCGVILEKRSGVLMAFESQAGDKPVYYTRQKDECYITSHNNILVDALAKKGIRLKPDFQACREMTATASILFGKTPFQGVRHVCAGKYVLLDDQKAEEYHYHMFRDEPNNDLTMEQCIEELDCRFRKAVERICAKNAEYGYIGESDLSGGLDSRMATWVANDLGYHTLNLCYSQSGTLDHKISRKIAKDLGNEYVFQPLDGGTFIKDIDEMVDKYGGQVIYIISTGTNQAMKRLADRNIGMSMMGLLGGNLRMECISGDVSVPHYTNERYCALMPLQIPEEACWEYDNFFQVDLYELDMVRYVASQWLRQQQWEPYSPFVDVDYMEFVHSTPLELRENGKLFGEWMMQKYPKASSYLWHTQRMPVDKYYRNQIYWPKVGANLVRFATRGINKICRTLKIGHQRPLSTDMNPFDLWYQNSSEIRQFIDQYYQDTISLVKDEQLQQDLKMVFTKGNPFDKIQVIGTLAIFKRYFRE